MLVVLRGGTTAAASDAVVCLRSRSQQQAVIGQELVESKSRIAYNNGLI